MLQPLNQIYGVLWNTPVILSYKDIIFLRHIRKYILRNICFCRWIYLPEYEEVDVQEVYLKFVLFLMCLLCGSQITLFKYTIWYLIEYQNQSTGENERRFGAIYTRSKGDNQN